jgi:hypothetical protein
MDDDLASKNLPTHSNRNVPIPKLGHKLHFRKKISSEKIEKLALDKYQKCGKGINFVDVTNEFSCSKSNAQRKLKLCCSEHKNKKGQVLKPKLFREFKRSSPQQFLPYCKRAEIIEDLKNKQNVPVGPTGVNLSKASLFPSRYPLSNAIENQRAQSFLGVLILLPFTPPKIHKLQLRLQLDKEYYNELIQKEQPINRAKSFEEIIGRRHVIYRLSPNGTVEVSIRTTDTPFRIEKDEDVCDLFSFFGQVRDRFLYHVSDIRERHVPPILIWILKQCDLNKDVEIDDAAQLALPDIQLKSADRVFRLYIKIMKDRAYCRVEESLTLNQILPEALDNIRHPYKSLENKFDTLIKRLDKIYGLGSERNGVHYDLS